MKTEVEKDPIPHTRSRKERWHCKPLYHTIWLLCASQWKEELDGKRLLLQIEPLCAITWGRELVTDKDRGFSNRCWSKEGLERAADRVPNPTYSGIELLNLNPDFQIGCQLRFTSASSNAPDSPTDFMNSLFSGSPIHFKFDRLRKNRLHLLPVSPCPISCIQISSISLKSPIGHEAMGLHGNALLGILIHRIFLLVARRGEVCMLQRLRPTNKPLRYQTKWLMTYLSVTHFINFSNFLT